MQNGNFRGRTGCRYLPDHGDSATYACLRFSILQTHGRLEFVVAACCDLSNCVETYGTAVESNKRRLEFAPRGGVSSRQTGNQLQQSWPNLSRKSMAGFNPQTDIKERGQLSRLQSGGIGQGPCHLTNSRKPSPSSGLIGFVKMESGADVQPSRRLNSSAD